MRVQFQVAATTAQRSGVCPVCGKRVVRSKRFEMTVNPYNRDESGTPKSWERVCEDVRGEAAAWVPDFTHAKCVEVVS